MSDTRGRGECSTRVVRFGTGVRLLAVSRKPLAMQTDPQIAEIAAVMSEAQRVVMLGELIEITPEECEQLEAWGLKEPLGDPEKRTSGGMLIWPITPRGLAVRRHLQSVAAYLKEQSNG